MKTNPYLRYRKAHKVGNKLIKEEKGKRKDWAQCMLDMGMDWESVFFCDEKYFLCDGTTSSAKVWADVRDPPPKKNSRCHGGGGVKVWVGISADGLSPVELCPKEMNAKDYAEILDEHIPATCSYIMHDGWPVHRAAEPKEVLSEKGIQDLLQPPYSSDLQPAEQVLAVLSNEVYKQNKQYTDIKSLKKGISDAFNRIKSGDTQSKYKDTDLFLKLS